MANEEKKVEYLQFTAENGSASELFKIPHTYQDVGAAPGEFGLGEAAKQIVDWNSATKTGFYWSTGEAANRPFDWQAAWGYTIAANENESPDLTQVAFTYTGGSGSTMRDNSYQKVRYCKGTTGWSEWEWVNPPMTAGKEYRTTERYAGKPVYAMLYSGGASATTLSISIPEDATKLLRYKVWTKDYLLPIGDPNKTSYYAYTCLNVNNPRQIVYYADDKRDGYGNGKTVFIQAWYIK